MQAEKPGTRSLARKTNCHSCFKSWACESSPLDLNLCFLSPFRASVLLILLVSPPSRAGLGPPSAGERRNRNPKGKISLLCLILYIGLGMFWGTNEIVSTIPGLNSDAWQLGSGIGIGLAANTEGFLHLWGNPSCEQKQNNSFIQEDEEEEVIGGHDRSQKEKYATGWKVNKGGEKTEVLLSFDSRKNKQSFWSFFSGLFLSPYLSLGLPPPLLLFPFPQLSPLPSSSRHQLTPIPF